MIDYRDVREFKKSETRKNSEVTVVVWVPGDGGAPYVHSIILSGDRREWSRDDPNRPSYHANADLTGDIESAFEAGFTYAETLIQG